MGNDANALQEAIAAIAATPDNMLGEFEAVKLPNTVFTRHGNSFMPTNQRQLDLHEKLPPGNFIIKMTAEGVMYFEQVDSFGAPGKIYGKTNNNAARILNTFDKRENQTGVMLCGEKGSGKTLLARQVSRLAESKGIPTIIVNVPWHGDKFNKLLQDVQQPAIVLFDEFEKTYDAKQQEAVLTLFDGVVPSNKLFILTCNNKWRVDEHMHNRPGRIYYMFSYEGLDKEFIREYCIDNLINQSRVDEVVRVSMLFSKFNFDMLKAMVEEMNRYQESALEVLDVLNVKPASERDSIYIIRVFDHGKEVGVEHLHTNQLQGTPLGHEALQVSFERVTGPKDKDGDYSSDYTQATLTGNELKNIDVHTGDLTYETEDGITVVFARKSAYRFDPKTYERAVAPGSF